MLIIAVVRPALDLFDHIDELLEGVVYDLLLFFLFLLFLSFFLGLFLSFFLGLFFNFFLDFFSLFLLRLFFNIFLLRSRLLLRLILVLISIGSRLWTG